MSLILMYLDMVQRGQWKDGEHNDRAKPTLLLLVDTVVLDDEGGFGLTEIQVMTAFDDCETTALLLLYLLCCRSVR